VLEPAHVIDEVLRVALPREPDVPPSAHTRSRAILATSRFPRATVIADSYGVA
jgi:hypothetical protein